MTMKIFSQITLSVIAILTLTGTAFASGWQQNTSGWWYATNDTNTAWHANGWQWLDGNGDGVAECYYFDDNGYALTNTTTPDGYQVNSDGAWVVNGAVQTKNAATDNSANASSAATSSDETIVVTRALGTADSLGSIEAAAIARSRMVADNGGYNEQGVSNSALYALWHTKEENKQFGELLVDKSAGNCVHVYYKNGLFVNYPTNNSESKLVYFDTGDKNKDVKYMSKYSNGTDGDSIMEDMLNAGFVRSDLVVYSRGVNARLSDGTNLSTGPNGSSLNLPAEKNDKADAIRRDLYTE